MILSSGRVIRTGVVIVHVVLGAVPSPQGSPQSNEDRFSFFTAVTKRYGCYMSNVISFSWTLHLHSSSSRCRYRRNSTSTLPSSQKEKPMRYSYPFSLSPYTYTL
ncbi:uncharacterized protein F5891DRAFT_37253 [Suillus fuscotomentosus]|uniref:Secreted protein n=1 Tax=Suillus fuscotomentosus TaxID=1912939 RepID=A0AAD4EFZ9_9AGAM|nr:uncharacterized protein F5891DRAFT_37253 [Suillus fuscotomentosus]KAG1904263.1 hypothetical protein F5891DRAFT_37253 [Suillus fuscotomentosus]